MHAIALAAREQAYLLLLIGAAKVEAADVRARRCFVRAYAHDVLAVTDLVPNGLVVVQRVAALIDVGELHRVTGADRAGAGFFLAGHHAEQRRFAGAVRADDADDAAGRQTEGHVLEQHAVAERLADLVSLDDEIAEPGAGRDVNLVRLVARLKLFRCELLEARE